MGVAVPDILGRIVERKREELREMRVPVSELERRAEEATRFRRPFAKALRTGKPSIIAEIKRGSPSRGILAENFEPARTAVEYERGGAASISVLTDRDFFYGGMEDLEAARAVVTLPVLRKDFTISEVQILEAAAHGADAILLIAAILSEAELQRYREMAAQFLVAALVEVHDAEELRKAVNSGAAIIGVNNRDLRDFKTRLETSYELAGQIPSSLIRVTESGIRDREDVRRLAAAGYDAFLVGEHLMRAADPAAELERLRCS